MESTVAVMDNVSGERRAIVIVTRREAEVLSFRDWPIMLMPTFAELLNRYWLVPTAYANGMFGAGADAFVAGVAAGAVPAVFDDPAQADNRAMATDEQLKRAFMKWLRKVTTCDC
jgi:hypothetical protein